MRAIRKAKDAGSAGYDETWADEAEAQKYECMICKCVARSALAPACCGELFCELCWVRCQGREARCPHCRQDTVLADAAHKDRKMIQNLEIHCSYGCGDVHRLGNKERHANECLRRPVRCPRCDEDLEAVELEQHLASCQASYAFCKLCGERYVADELEEHLASNVGKHMKAMMSALQELDVLRAEVAQLKAVDKVQKAREGRGGGILAPPEGGSKASKAAGTLWHPGRICPKPNGIKRENSEESINWEDGYGFDEYSVGWRSGDLTATFPKTASGREFGPSFWSCCGGLHDAVGCQRRHVEPRN